VGCRLRDLSHQFTADERHWSDDLGHLLPNKHDSDNAVLDPEISGEKVTRRFSFEAFRFL
jgi:hypothetical protein